MRYPTAGRLVAAAALARRAPRCAKDPEIFARAAAGRGDAAFMARYVALGNSITAGYQSGGINDSTQRRAYPALIARAFGLALRVPGAVRQGPGCAPLPDAATAFQGAAGTLTRPSSVCARTAGVHHRVPQQRRRARRELVRT